MGLFVKRISFVFSNFLCVQISFFGVKKAKMACAVIGCCWCDLCQARRLQRYEHMPLEVLLRQFNLHGMREDRCLDDLFEEILQASVYGKLIKLSIQRDTPYAKPGNFFKYSDRFQHLSDDERKSLATRINQAAWIHDNIDTIHSNLAAVRRDAHVDIRRLSMSQLYCAKSLNWCHQYAASLASKSDKPANLSYTDEQFNSLMAKIMTDPCFQAVDGDRTKVASLGARIQSSLLGRMRKVNE